MFASCVEFGLSQSEIRDFSLSWPQPITTVQQVSDKIKAMGLRTKYDHRERKRVGYHNKSINETFVKIASQLMQFGWSVERFTRERKVFDFSPVRPDFYLEAVKGKSRIMYCFEVQASKSKFTLWGDKLRQYVKTYEKCDHDQLIRVPIMVHSLDEMTRARAEARRILKEFGRDVLNLFLFTLIDEVKRKHDDVVSTRIWKSAWNGQHAWSLVV